MQKIILVGCNGGAARHERYLESGHFVVVLPQTRNVHFNMSHLKFQRWAHAQRNMRSFVVIVA
jgi:hypothetical protein